MDEQHSEHSATTRARARVGSDSDQPADQSADAVARVPVGSEDPGHVTGPEKDFLADGFGRILREERERAGVTVAELAEQTTIAERVIRRFEAGERRPRADTIDLLALALRRPRPVGMRAPDPLRTPRTMDAAAARALAREMKDAAGDSLREGVVHKRRNRAMEHLMKFGMTPAERKEAQAEALARQSAAMTRNLNRAREALAQAQRMRAASHADLAKTLGVEHR